MPLLLRRPPLLPVLVLALTVAVQAQIPTTFTNLQVLPKDISRGELIGGVMRSFAGSLGVRCLHCHVGTDGDRFSDVDFAADDLEPKRVARVMLAMVAQINETLASKTGRDLADLTEVTCYTCHHGNNFPVTLRAALGDAYSEGGAQELLRRYGELREEYYGRAVYDFAPHALVRQAEGLVEQHEDPDGALAVLKANLKHFPDSDYTYYVLGQVYLESGEKKLGVRALRKAVKISPDNSWYRQALAEAQKD